MDVVLGNKVSLQLRKEIKMGGSIGCLSSVQKYLQKKTKILMCYNFCGLEEPISTELLKLAQHQIMVNAFGSSLFSC